ncbi:MAG TPA: hypothetical protein VFN68_08915 [Acidimicrobiales bacterium]|nr:hypothetical protein [Acidimicrobiales bacterium]
MSSPSPDLTVPGRPGSDALVARAYDLSRAGVTQAAVDELLSAASESRPDLEAARDRVAARVHARVDDFDATAALQLLNRALSRAPIHDPLDWKPRWGQRFRRP